MYCLNLLEIALDPGRPRRRLRGLATKFFEHFTYIAVGDERPGPLGRDDGFYYDIIRGDDGTDIPIRVRSMVGLRPAVRGHACWSPGCSPSCPTSAPASRGSPPTSRRSPTWSSTDDPATRDRQLSPSSTPSAAPDARPLLDEDEFLSRTGCARCRRVSPRPPLRLSSPGGSATRRLRAGGVPHRPLRRQLELAGTGVVSAQLPAGRGLAPFPRLLRGRLHRRVPDRLGPAAQPGAVADEICRRLVSIFLRRRTAAGPSSAATSCSSATRPGTTCCPSTSTSTATTAPASGRPTRPAGPDWWRTCWRRHRG